MSSDAIQFASNVERVEFSGRGLQRIMADKGARYCLKIGHNLLAISKTSGCLLGESLADHLGVKGSGVITFQHGGKYTIVSYGSNGVVSSEYIDVQSDDYYLLLAGECADKQTLWVACDDDGRVTATCCWSFGRKGRANATGLGRMRAVRFSRLGDVAANALGAVRRSPGQTDQSVRAAAHLSGRPAPAQRPPPRIAGHGQPAVGRGGDRPADAAGQPVLLQPGWGIPGDGPVAVLGQHLDLIPAGSPSLACQRWRPSGFTKAARS